MPFISIKLFEDLADAPAASALIAATTDAIVDVMGEGMRPYTTVVVEPVPRSHWGVAGAPTTAAPGRAPADGDAG